MQNARCQLPLPNGIDLRTYKKRSPLLRKVPLLPSKETKFSYWEMGVRFCGSRSHSCRFFPAQRQVGGVNFSVLLRYVVSKTATSSISEPNFYHLRSLICPVSMDCNLPLKHQDLELEECLIFLGTILPRVDRNPLSYRNLSPCFYPQKWSHRESFHRSRTLSILCRRTPLQIYLSRT